MIHYYPYNPFSEEIVTETLTIDEGRVQLRHIPQQNSIFIQGFSETQSVNILPHQFRCDYSLDTMYREANRILYFNSIHNGTEISITYNAVGTVFTADDANEIKNHLENQEIHSSYNLPTASSTLKGGIKIGSGLSMSGEVLSADAYNLPTASSTLKGGIKVGSNLSMSGEKLSARGNINFKGALSSLPSSKTFGDLVFVDGKAYIFDGNDWLKFCQCESSGDDSIKTTVDSTFWTAYGSPTIQDDALYLNGNSYLRSNIQYYTWQWLREPFTLDIDFKTSASGNQITFIDTTYFFYLYITEDGNLELDIADNDDNEIFITTPNAVNDGAWHHARFEFEGSAEYGYTSVFKLFCDGQLIGSDSNPDITWRDDSLFVGRGFIGSLKNLVVNGPDMYSSHGNMYAVFSDRFDKVNWT